MITIYQISNIKERDRNYKKEPNVNSVVEKYVQSKQKFMGVLTGRFLLAEEGI